MLEARIVRDCKDYFSIPAISASYMKRVEWYMRKGVGTAESLENMKDSLIVTEAILWGKCFHSVMEGKDLVRLTFNPSKAQIAVMESEDAVAAYIKNYKNKTVDAGIIEDIQIEIDKIKITHFTWIEAKADGLCACGPEMYDEVMKAVERVKASDMYRVLHDRAETIMNEVVLLGNDDSGDIDLAVKGMLDEVIVISNKATDETRVEYITIIDWKTTSDIDNFMANYKKKSQYWRQFALYFEMAKSAFDVPVHRIKFMVCVISSTTGYHEWIEVSEEDLKKGLTGGYLNPFGNFNDDGQIAVFLKKKVLKWLKMMKVPVEEHRAIGVQTILQYLGYTLSKDTKYKHTPLMEVIEPAKSSTDHV